MSYTINFTDKTKPPIILDDGDIDNSTDIVMFGRTRLAYGEELQENLLHILENFSCPESTTNPGNPDTTKASTNTFAHVTEGQFWYNSTKNILNYYDGIHWIPLAREDGIAANWGIIADGEFLPNPVSEISGRIFSYAESVWIVSPFSFPQKIDYMTCRTNDDGLVTMQYRIKGTNELVSGLANYLIVGIAGNMVQTPPPQPSFTPTPTPTPTSSVGTSHTPAVTVTPTVTPQPSVTRTVTPQPSVTGTPAVTRTTTPTPTPTPSTAIPSALSFQGQNIHAFTDSPPRCPGVGGQATIQVTFNADGTYSINTTSNQFGQNRTPNQSGTWLPSGWSVADSTIMFSGVATNNGEANPADISNSAPTYKPLTTTQIYSLSTSGGCTAGTGMGSDVALTISIRRVSTGTTFNTTCTLSCESSDAGM